MPANAVPNFRCIYLCFVFGRLLTLAFMGSIGMTFVILACVLDSVVT
jgi:hypothetical protein